MKDRRILSVTGGSTKFIQLVAGMIKLEEKGYNFTDIICKSASGIAVLPFVFGLHEELVQEGLNVEFEKIFTSTPVTRTGGIHFKGIIRAVLSFLFPNITAFGKQDTKHLIRKYITKDMYRKYLTGDYPNIHVVTVDNTQGIPVIFNLKNIFCYEEALSIIAGSSKITPMVEYEPFEGLCLVDGGMILAGGAGYIMETNYIKSERVESVVSLYSWTNPFPDCSEDWKKNVFSNTKRSSELLKAGGKYYGPRHEYWYCKANGIPLEQLFVPDVLDQLYDIDDKDLENAYNQTLEYLDKKLK